MAELAFAKIGSFKSVDQFQAYVGELGLELPCDTQVLSASQGSPLAAPLDVSGLVVGNRWCIHPMEGWDATTTGEPTETVLRRWQHFGQSGAKLLWGGEAFAVQGDGRANPHQLGVVDGDFQRAQRGLVQLLKSATTAHQQKCGRTDDLLLGLQLTHSGRFCRPGQGGPQPKIAYHHPLLDRRLGIAADDDSTLVSDDYLERLIDNYIQVSKLAHKAGFGFVDVKHCHGYLGHELLSARTRKGKFGGSLENRARFARQIIQGIQAECPGLRIGVRLSVFDQPPYKAAPTGGGNSIVTGVGIPDDYQSCLPYLYGFGCRADNPLEMDLTEPIAFIQLLAGLGVRLINLTCGSPYYNPHIQRPAMFPPSDGYQPPEDPLAGVCRQIHAAAQVKAACPQSIFVGTAYTYLQDYLPQVAQAVIRQGMTDFIGLGRMVLSYWDLPYDVLAGRPLQYRRVCRTFSDCTTAPRGGMISGCFPLDPFYKDNPVAEQLKQKKTQLKKGDSK